MNVTHVSISIYFTLGCAIAGSQAQTAVTASGGNATGIGGSASYSVGQMVYTTNVSASGSVAQGVQQSYAVTVISSRAETDGITCSVFPNPATDFIQLDIAGSTASNLRYQLTDLHGRLLQQGSAGIGSARIDLVQYAHTGYFLRVTEGNAELKTFQIVKN